jgi:alkylhydroperoxidase/carboxymuconolactone decarboxylase family protein YurZ
LNNGLTPEELVEVVLHTARYAGMPAANDAILSLLEVLQGFDDSSTNNGSS